MKKIKGGNMKIKTGIAVFDLHYPEHDGKLWKNILKLTKEINPDYFLLGGDNLNMTAVSHWLQDKGKKRALEGKRLIKEYNDFTKDILVPLKETLKKTAEKYWLYGNHEHWVTEAIDKNPQGEGYWEVENNINLKDWNITKFNDVCRIGKMYFIHGVYTNDHHAKKTVTVYEKNIFYGHAHTLQIYTKITPLKNEGHIAVACPSACKQNPEYRRNMPSAWLSGLLVFYIMDDGNFNAYPVIATKGSFIWNDKVY